MFASLYFDRLYLQMCRVSSGKQHSEFAHVPRTLYGAQMILSFYDVLGYVVRKLQRRTAPEVSTQRIIKFKLFF